MVNQKYIMTMTDLRQDISNECSIKLLPSTDFVYCESVRSQCDVVLLPLFHNNTSHTLSCWRLSVQYRCSPSLLPSCMGPPTLHHPLNFLCAFQYLVTCPSFPQLWSRGGGRSVSVSGEVGRQTAAVHARTRGPQDLTGWERAAERSPGRRSR